MAQGDGRRVIRNAAYRWNFNAVDQNGQPISGLAASIAAKVSLDGGTFTTIAGTVTEIGSVGAYYVDLIAAEFTGDEIVGLATSGTMWTVHEKFKPEPALDSGVATGAGASSLTLRASASATNDFYNGGTLEIVRGTGKGQVRSVIDYAGSTKIATVDRAWITTPDTTSVYIIHPLVGPKLTTDIRAATDVQAISGDATAADALEALYESLITGSIDDVSPSTTSFDGDSGLSSTDDFYNNMLLVLRSGDDAGICRKISDYDGTNKTITLASALPATPANGDTFFIISLVT